MRERLVTAFVGFTIAVLALFGVPRAYQVADLVQTQEQRKVDRSADLVAVLVREKLADDRPVTPELLDATLHEGEHVEYVAPDGSRTGSTTPYQPAADDLTAHRSLPDGASVTLRRSADLVDDRVSDALLPLVVIVILLLLLSAAAGWLLARRLARPFQRLAVAARRIGTDRFDVDLPVSGIPEAQEIGAALRSSAQRIDVLLEHERELAVHASHELRTPVTALRLELEDLALWPQTAPEVAEQLAVAVADLDRLSEAITRLLDRSRSHRVQSARDVELSALVAEVVAERRAAGQDETVRVEGGPLGAHLDPVAFKRLVGLLLDDAQVPGPGAVDVGLSGAATHLEVRVTWGDGASPEVDRRADEVARGIGGQLVPFGGERSGVALRLARAIVAGAD